MKFDKKKSFEDRMFDAVPYIIAGTFVIVICGWVVMAVAGYMLVGEVQEHGAQGIFQSVWCGKDGCNDH